MVGRCFHLAAAPSSICAKVAFHREHHRRSQFTTSISLWPQPHHSPLLVSLILFLAAHSQDELFQLSAEPEACMQAVLQTDTTTFLLHKRHVEDNNEWNEPSTGQGGSRLHCQQVRIYLPSAGCALTCLDILWLTTNTMVSPSMPCYARDTDKGKSIGGRRRRSWSQSCIRSCRSRIQYSMYIETVPYEKSHGCGPRRYQRSSRKVSTHHGNSEEEVNISVACTRTTGDGTCTTL